MSEDCLFDLEIHIAGIQRSGLHAFVNWLLGNLKTAVYRNDAGYDIYDGIYNFEYFKEGVKEKECQHPVKAKAIIICHENGDSSILKKYPTHPKYLESVARACATNNINRFSDKKINYLNIRDPYNNLASAWKLFKNKELLIRLTETWLKTAKYIVDSPAQDITPVLFNKWRTDKALRQRLVKFLEGFSDKNLNRMMGYGGGSSFSKVKHKTDASKLDLDNRWKSFEEDKFYLSLFNKYPEIKKYSNILFNYKPF